jgi:hypothetical protein
LVGFEPATEYPVGPVASTLTTRPPRALTMRITVGITIAVEMRIMILAGIMKRVVVVGRIGTGIICVRIKIRTVRITIGLTITIGETI